MTMQPDRRLKIPHAHRRLPRPAGGSAPPRRLLADTVNSDDLTLIESCAAFAQDVIQATCTPGLSVALARGGQIIWTEAFGFADVVQETLMQVDTTFPVGSMGKPFVAIAVMQLIEDGVLELYAPVRRYLPDLPLQNPLGEREVTIYDLLTYRSGLAMDAADHAGSCRPLKEYVYASLTAASRREYDQSAPRWIAKVGAGYHYSTLGIAILGYLVERMNSGGLSFADYIDQRVSRPLGLASTGLYRDAIGQHDSGLLARRCNGYARFGPVWVESPNVAPQATPANSLLTTPHDYATFLLAIMGSAAAPGRSIVQVGTARLMVTPQVAVDDGLSSGWWNGLGFELREIGRPDFRFGHEGIQPWGWWCAGAAFPLLDVVIVAACNRWNMPVWYNHPLETGPRLVVDFVQKWFCERTSTSQRRVPTKSWAWRVSWTIGFALAERTVALLGAADGLDEACIEELAQGACAARGDADEVWDADGFRAGARAMLALEPTPAAIAAYLNSAEAPVTFADFPSLALALGQRRTLAIPHPFFAPAAEERLWADAVSPVAFGDAVNMGRR